MKNIIYLKHVLPIGGVETFVYELAKKYHKDFEIVLFYETADPEQLKRFKQFIYCEQFDRRKRYECDKFITNYAIDMIDFVDAKEYIEIIHANFMLQKELTPHLHAKIDKYVAVSKETAKAWEERTGFKASVCPNPLTWDEIKYAPLEIFAAQRMSKEKGVDRIIALVNRLNADPEIKYNLTICNNQTTSTYSSAKFILKNVGLMPSSLDIRDKIASCDIFLVLSDSEGRSYGVAEKLASGYGMLLATPLPVFKEMGCDETNTIYLNFDLSNMDEVVAKLKAIYKTKILPQTFKPVNVVDKWNKLLAKGKSEYKPKKMVMCRATDMWRKKNLVLAETGCMPYENEVLTLSEERYEELHNSKKFDCCLVTDKKEI